MIIHMNFKKKILKRVSHFNYYQDSNQCKERKITLKVSLKYITKKQ